MLANTEFQLRDKNSVFWHVMCICVTGNCLSKVIVNVLSSYINFPIILGTLSPIIVASFGKFFVDCPLHNKKFLGIFSLYHQMILPIGRAEYTSLLCEVESCRA